MTHPQPTTADIELRQIRGGKTSFQNLDRFVAEITSEGGSPPTTLTKTDLDELASVALEIQDAANNLEFEAAKIHEKLSSIII